MKTLSKPHYVMIGRSALLSDSLPWTSDKTGRNASGPVAIRIRQREFRSIQYQEYKSLFLKGFEVRRPCYTLTGIRAGCCTSDWKWGKYSHDLQVLHFTVERGGLLFFVMFGIMKFMTQEIAP